MNMGTLEGPLHSSILHLRSQVYSAADLRSDVELAFSLAGFINEGYEEADDYKAERWETDIRLSNPQEIYDIVGSEGLLSVLYDEGTPIACAATAPWRGDLEGFSKPLEDGWEIKTVTVKPKFRKKGLAIRCIAILQERLKEIERERMEKEAEKDCRNVLKLWIQTVEDVNGNYWHSRGWKDDRVYEKPVGVWGAKYDWRLAIMVKEIDLPTGIGPTT